MYVNGKIAIATSEINTKLEEIKNAIDDLEITDYTTVYERIAKGIENLGGEPKTIYVALSGVKIGHEPKTITYKVLGTTPLEI